MGANWKSCTIAPNTSSQIVRSLIDWHGASHFECVKWSINCWIWFRFQSPDATLSNIIRLLRLASLMRNALSAGRCNRHTDDQYANFGWLLVSMGANKRFGNWSDHSNVNEMTSLLAKWMFHEREKIKNKSTCSVWLQCATHEKKTKFAYLFYEFLMISPPMSSRCRRPRRTHVWLFPPSDHLESRCAAAIVNS